MSKIQDINAPIISPHIWSESLKWAHTPAERDDLIDLALNFPSVKLAIRNDITIDFLRDLRYRLFGKIPRNWVVNVQGLIGTPAGVFKSALGLNIARATDPTFNLNTLTERVAFTPHQLIQLVEHYGAKKQVFVLDEHIHDLKFSAQYQLQNIVEQCREHQLCFVFCGVPKDTYTFSTYVLERCDESRDEYLPKKRVRFLVRRPDTNRFRGVVIWDIPPLGIDKEWTAIWDKYMVLKNEHQLRVKKGQISGFDFKSASHYFIEHIGTYLIMNKLGEYKVNRAMLEMDIYHRHPDLTNQERKFVYTSVLKELLTKKIITQKPKQPKQPKQPNPKGEKSGRKKSKNLSPNVNELVESYPIPPPTTGEEMRIVEALKVFESAEPDG